MSLKTITYIFHWYWPLGDSTNLVKVDVKIKTPHYNDWIILEGVDIKEMVKVIKADYIKRQKEDYQSFMIEFQKLDYSPKKNAQMKSHKEKLLSVFLFENQQKTFTFQKLISPGIYIYNVIC